MPQPFPHRVSFLATTGAGLVQAKLIAAVVFDHLVRHPVESMSDFDDDRLADDDGQLIDARHPDAEELVDWQFRVNRRADVLWLELSFDAARDGRDTPPRLYARRPVGPIETWTAEDRRAPLSMQLCSVIDQWLAARRLPAAGEPDSFTRAELIATGLELERLITDHTGGA